MDKITTMLSFIQPEHTFLIEEKFTAGFESSTSSIDQVQWGGENRMTICLIMCKNIYR